MKSGDERYIHGTEPDEQRRLSALNDILNERSLRALDVHPGDRILDVGSGLGQLTRAMARRTGTSGLVVGIDESRRQITEAEKQAAAMGEVGLVEFRCGTAYELPLEIGEWGTFDVAHARFLLEHVADPDRVVSEMCRAVRPGGRVVLEDDDHDVLRLWPRAPDFERLWNGYIETYVALGFDPFIGRRLVGLLRGAGAVATRNDWHFFGGCQEGPMFDELVANFAGIVEGARETLLSVTPLDEGIIERGIRAFIEWSKKPGASMWYATFWAEGRKGAEQDSE